jgi:DNA repair protein RadC
MRTRRTKNQIEKDRYNSDVDSYQWYVVNLDTKRAETGFEFKEDAIDLLNDYENPKKYKVVSKRTLKIMGIENPNASFKYVGGGYTDLSKQKPEVINESESEKEDAEILEAIQTLQSLLNDSSKKDNDEIVNNNSISKDGVEIPEIDIEKIKMIDLNITDNKILSLEDTIRVLKQLYDKGSINAYEEVKVLYLDNSNRVIGVYTHSKGGIAGTIVDVEMICGLALKCLAKGVIMSHNHPSGSLIFSDADIRVTRELKNGLNLFKIALLDSVIITDNGYESMTKQGILANGGSLSRFDNGGALIGNQKRIDLNKNGKIDAEDFKLLRSTMNGAWRNEHEHVNSTSRKNGKVIEYEVRYAKKNKPSRTGYKGKTDYATGGGVYSLSEYSNDALYDMIINLSRYKNTESEIKMIKAELEKRKANKKMATGGKVNKDIQITPSIKNFIDSLKKKGNFIKGNEQKNVNGILYRFDEYKLINPSSFMVTEFKKLVEKNYGVLSLSNGYDFRRINLEGNKVIFADLPKFNGGHTDYITFRELVILNKTGGAFQMLSNKVANNYEGKRVKPQYQKEYGKVYSKEEAKEVGHKVAGKVKSMK